MAVVRSLAFVVRSRLALQVEILALRHQLAVYQRAENRLRLGPADRLLWAWLSRAWSGWRETLVMVQPRTVIAWRATLPKLLDAPEPPRPYAVLLHGRHAYPIPLLHRLKRRR